MIQEISVGVVVAGAAYWILRKVFRHLAEGEGSGGCGECTACSIPAAQNPHSESDASTGCSSCSYSTRQ